MTETGSHAHPQPTARQKRPPASLPLFDISGAPADESGAIPDAVPAPRRSIQPSAPETALAQLPVFEPASRPAPRSEALGKNNAPDWDRQIAIATPMMAQVLEAKKQHPDCLVLVRAGDFYEIFLDDAVAASAAIGLTLTKRGKHDGEDVPMCGVPLQALETTVARLIRLGFRIAICEQTESPEEVRKRVGKALIRREVVRVVTPGTLTEDALLDARGRNWLVAVAEVGGAVGIAWLDLSTGEFGLEETDRVGMGPVLGRLDPSEIVLPEHLAGAEGAIGAMAEWRGRLTPLPRARFDPENGRRRLEKVYGVLTLDGFGRFGRAEHAAGGALLDYVDLTQKGRAPRPAVPTRLRPEATMSIDPGTRRSLEMMRSQSGEREGSLLWAVDRTRTGAGARRLMSDLSAPLVDPAEIDERLDCVEWLHGRSGVCSEIRDVLSSCPDIERALSRLMLGRGGPRDLAAVAQGLTAAAAASDCLRRAGTLPRLLDAVAAALAGRDALAAELHAALARELPLSARDGGWVVAGHDMALDELRRLAGGAREAMAELQAGYVEKTGIQALKVRHNGVIGWHIEIPSAQAERLVASSDPGTFVHRQTLAGVMRFSTSDLAALERRAAEAQGRALEIEIAIFQRLAEACSREADALRSVASALARLDVASSLAGIAQERGWCRPEIDRSTDFVIRDGRHPVVEAVLASQGTSFTPNSCDLSAATRSWLITGPNMAGKSTFLRQNALITILAQAGSFVPARSCRIGAVDRLFSRVGASDDLARGRSTFMVEMVETALILNQAGPRSLVVLDEIGRGTATWDGMSLAAACLEHLHDRISCRTLFATHYHELKELAERLPALALRHMLVREWQDDLVFLHEIAEGSAAGSYGLHVARLAGLPARVVSRAAEILTGLESSGSGGQIPPPAPENPLAPHPAVARLRGLDPDQLTPRDALALLYELRDLSREGA